MRDPSPRSLSKVKEDPYRYAETALTRDLNRVRGALARIPTASLNTYEGADPENAARLAAVICLLSGLLTVAFLPLDPPTEEIGAAGWVGAAAIIAATFAGGRWLLRARPVPSFDWLLGFSYLGLVQVAVLVWLAGGAGTAYQKLVLLWVGAAAGVHPARRALVFLGATAVVASAPLVYDGWSSDAARTIASDVLLWWALGLITLGLMTYVRAQRVRLRADEEAAQELARADALTGLGNRLAFDEALQSEMARSARANSTMSVVILDIDDFKNLNDRYGHLEGDRCLRNLAETIREATRGGDRGFRWGGDEFILLLPDTAYDGAEDTAARLASDVLNHCADADGKPLSISWGSAEIGTGMDADELLGHADLALMNHKRQKLTAQSGG
jgi:diguanylate cyclase (GGDEF)-like protein